MYSLLRTVLIWTICTMAVGKVFALPISPATPHHLLPQPQHYKALSGTFTAQRVRLQADALQHEALEWLRQNNIRVSSKARHRMTLSLVPSLPIEQGVSTEEAYRLSITPQAIRVEAITPTGIFRGLQTLSQLSEEYPAQLPACEIVDWPAWRIRGFMHDVGRTYIPLTELKRQVKLLSYFKINVLHWHLTENQAWRLESRAFPQLNAPEHTTRMAGKYYTLREAKELAEWCRKHHVLLIPEIDMPGHSAAFERAMGFGMQTKEGKATLKTLLTEVAEAMQVPYIHIGTDEVQFTDPTFVPEMVAFVRSLGKKVISWNPGWHYKTGEIDMTHLWSYRGTAQAGIPAIDSRLHYTNHYDLFADLVALYNSQIHRSPKGSQDLAGAIIAIWNDRFVPDTKTLMAENNLYPTMLALAERGWLGGGYGYFDEQTNLLTRVDSPQYQKFADFERRLLWHKEHSLAQEPIPYVRQSQASWVITDAFPNDGELDRAFPPEESKEASTPPHQLPSHDYQGRSYRSRQVYGSGFYLRHTWGEKIFPSVYTKPQEQHTAYAMTWVYTEQAQRVGLLFETQNYSRSESDLPPPQDKWDYRNSRIWINGEEIKPPHWTATHSTRDNEIPLGNENIASRKPIPVQLAKGWNKVLIKLPIDKFRAPETRLVKWMFTASFVDPSGKCSASVRYHHFGN